MGLPDYPRDGQFILVSSRSDHTGRHVEFKVVNYDDVDVHPAHALAKVLDTGTRSMNDLNKAIADHLTNVRVVDNPFKLPNNQPHGPQRKGKGGKAKRW